MPRYDYECAACGRFEVQQHMTDATLTTCPTCGGPVEKQYSVPAIRFVGGGWPGRDGKAQERVRKSESAIEHIPAQIGSAERGKHALR